MERSLRALAALRISIKAMLLSMLCMKVPFGRKRTEAQVPGDEARVRNEPAESEITQEAAQRPRLPSLSLRRPVPAPIQTHDL